MTYGPSKGATTCVGCMMCAAVLSILQMIVKSQRAFTFLLRNVCLFDVWCSLFCSLKDAGNLCLIVHLPFAQCTQHALTLLLRDVHRAGSLG